MKPNNGGSTESEGWEGSSGNEFDARRALQKATDKTRANLLADVIGHPEGAPSVEELCHKNPSLSEAAVRYHLDVLREVSVVEELEVEPGDRHRGHPYKFYTLTAEARELFDQTGLFPKDAWRRQYTRVERTPRIRELEAIPRPTEKKL